MVNSGFKPRQFNSRTLIASHTVPLEEINEYDKLNIIRKCAVNVKDMQICLPSYRNPFAQQCACPHHIYIGRKQVM